MKNHAFRVSVLLFAAAALVLGLAACKGKTMNERLAKKDVANMIAKATGGQATVDLKNGTLKVKTAEGEAEFGSSKEWPADLPGDVPKFSAGKIIGAVRSAQEDKKYWNITLQDVEAGAFDKYADALKAKGWEIKMTSKTEEGGILQAQKDKLMVVATFADKGRTVSLAVTNQID
jgi:hypothetical protein